VSEETRTTSVSRIRDLNQGAILRLLAAEAPLPRNEIARRLGLSPATITAVTRDLIGRGLVRVVDRAPSNGGRPAILLDLVPSGAQAIGVKIASDHVTVVLTSLDGEVLERVDEPFDATTARPVDALARLLKRLARALDATSLLGVGIGIPGVVDARRGHVSAPALGWHDLAVGDVLERRLGLPVLVDNDVNTLAIAERLYGQGRSCEDFVTVTIGRGIGLGIVAAGELYRGFRGGAGEFGHVTADADGLPCECGKRGCLETIAADPALHAAGVAAGLLERGAGIDELRTRATEGNAKARRLYKDAGTTLGRAVGDLVNVLGPELVIVSGEGVRAWPLLEDAFRQSMEQAVFAPLRDVRVAVDPWDDAKWARGAASLVLRPTLAPAFKDSRPDDLVRARFGGRLGEPPAAEASTDRPLRRGRTATRR
jgi:predicted NBD/HSP70 family sugar kinase